MERGVSDAARFDKDALSSQLPLPLYLQLARYVRSLIVGGKLGHRDALPSERELAERFEVSRVTVRKALRELSQEGLLEQIQGAGTFVNRAPHVEQRLSTLTSFSEDMRARGMVPGSIVLRQEVVPSGEIIARQLELDPGTPVVQIERVRTADGEPMAVERTYLPAGRFPDLENVDLTDVSLYETLSSRWSTQVAIADQWYSVIRPTESEAGLLGVQPDHPAMLVERVTRDPAGDIVEYVRSLYRGDRYEVHARLRRPGLQPEPPQS
jgi:GntR family transcriptional regulator